MKKGSPARPSRHRSLARLSTGDLRHIMTGARVMIWYALVHEREGGMDWSVRLSEEAAGERLWPVARAPEQTYTDAWYRARVPEDAARMDETFALAVREDRTHYDQEFRIRLADGQIRWLNEDVQMERLGAGRWRLVGVCTDITERKQEHEALRDVTAHVRAAIWYAMVRDLGQEMAWDTRLSNEEAVERLWPVAVPPSVAYTGAWYMARLPEDSARLNRNSTRALRSGRSHYAQEFRIRLADGQIRWLGEDVQIEPVGEGRWRLVGVCTDITERRREQETLREVMTSARALVWSAVVRQQSGGLDWQFSVLNQEAARRLWPVAVRRGQTYSQSWAASPLPEEQPRMDATCHAALLAGQPHYRQEYRVSLADGSVRWVGEEVQIEAQGPGHWQLVGVCTDITERKAAEEVVAAAHDRDRRIAETWQRSMLHEEPSDRFSGLRVKTFYEAALDEARVGGDFFDSLALDERRVALVVGDVSGKGLAAAARTAEVKYALRAFLHVYADPGEAMAHLNNLLCGPFPSLGAEEATLVVLSLAVVDRTTGAAVFAGAGAEPPLILRGAGAAEPVEAGGRVLGVGPGIAYPTRSVTLEIGDTVLMATDGITEARRGRTFLGPEGLAALAQQAGAGTSLVQIGRAVLSGAYAFTGGPLRDDACILLARREALPPPSR